MIWLNTSAWVALVALAAPILIHILVQRKAERLPFPTLRFILPTRLAAIRRHVLEDAPLLAIRAAILAVAVAALAGPLLVSAARRQAWNARLVQAIVMDNNGAAPGLPASVEQAGAPPQSVFSTLTFNTSTLPDGIRRARAWLDTAPPARREIVIVSPLALGSMTLEDVAAIPDQIGVRFERAGTLPEERTVEGGEVLGADQYVRPTVRRQSVIVNRASTSVIEAEVPAIGSFPVEVVGDNSTGPAIAAVLSQRVWAAPAGRRARLVLVGTSVDETAVAQAGAIAHRWMADAVGRIAQDAELQSAARGTTGGLVDARFLTAPWITLASASEGRPLAAAAGSPAGLVVVSAATASHLVTPLLLRAIAGGLADPPDLRSAEVLAIPDAQLQSWTRPASPVAVPRIDTVERDDRRWLWGLVVILLGVESWVRRARRDEDQETAERARVA